jgi:hypothetical protein
MRLLVLPATVLIAVSAAACNGTPVSPGAVAPYTASSTAAKPPANVAATAQFRCPGDCSAGDAIRGDGGANYAAGLNSNSEFDLTPTVSRVVWLDFGALTGCAGCRRNFTSVAVTNGVIHTNVVDPATGQLAANGLKSIPMGATWPSFIKVSFETVQNGVTVLWTLRFNPVEQPQTTTVDVTRTSATSWVIEAMASDLAALVSKEVRKRGETNEGAFVMPFRITVTTN